jgi:uncharacterized membrane protein YccC
VTYWIWPTWEQRYAPGVLADMLDVYRSYFEAVMHALIEGSALNNQVIATRRRAARIARTEAEMSVRRLRVEPGPRADGSGLPLATVEGILANSHRLVRNFMALETATYQDSERLPIAEVQQFAVDVDDSISALTEALRHPAHSIRADLPDLRADERKIAESATDGLSPLTHAADPIVNSLNTMVALLDAERNPAAVGDTAAG